MATWKTVYRSSDGAVSDVIDGIQMLIQFNVVQGQIQVNAGKLWSLSFNQRIRIDA